MNHTAHSRKLTDEQVVSIYYMDIPHGQQRVVAKSYGVSPAQICRIKHGKSEHRVLRLMKLAVQDDPDE